MERAHNNAVKANEKAAADRVEAALKHYGGYFNVFFIRIIFLFLKNK